MDPNPDDAIEKIEKAAEIIGQAAERSEEAAERNEEVAVKLGLAAGRIDHSAGSIEEAARTLHIEAEKAGYLLEGDLDWSSRYSAWRSGKIIGFEKGLKEYSDRAASCGWGERERFEILKAKLEAGIKLVDHEDKHNWNKYFNMIYLNLGFLVAYATALGKMDPGNAFLGLIPYFLASLALMGLWSSYGFMLTLWSGISCLVNSKEIVKSVDRHFAGVGDDPNRLGFPASIYLGKSGPSRILLVWGPVAFYALWLMLLALPLRKIWGPLTMLVLLPALYILPVCWTRFEGMSTFCEARFQGLCTSLSRHIPAMHATRARTKPRREGDVSSHGHEGC